MADDISDYVVCGRDDAASAASTVSWNTFLSRTNVSSLASAVFSEQENHPLHGLDDVIRAVTALGLRRYRYEEIAREEKVGEGETYIVERCVVANQVLAVKHLKTDSAMDDQTSHRRLRAVILELQILRHQPLRNHPNFPYAFGYGWNMNDEQVMPYLLVQYAPEGTLRQYIKSMASPIPRRDLHILAGDVASALCALHKCGIVHGDVKLDNVLVVHSWDRPAQALAKLTDFGHALIINDKFNKQGGIMRYRGTLIYNAPEVHDQDLFPIDRAAMPLCDIWALGVLIWELCLLGEDYVSYVQRTWPEVEAQMTEQRLKPADVRRYAMSSVPGNLKNVLIRASLHYTLQEDATKRIAHLEDLPLLTEWNDASISGLESELALHLESPSLTYEMFRFENGREIPWKHEEQIFQALNRTHSKGHAKDDSSVPWQLALCHHVGFGTPRNQSSACRYAQEAQVKGHPVAVAFASLLDPDFSGPSEPYVNRISSLLRSTAPPHWLPPVVQACFDGDWNALEALLSQHEDPNSSTIDGCTMFHWLFMLEGPEAMAETLNSRFGESAPFHPDLPFSCIRKAHDQWPLQLFGTPLASAISVNSLLAVKALLTLGASPLSHVYRKEDLPAGDARVEWTALHLAAKYHCSEILGYLLSSVPDACLSNLSPLACALPYSTSLERLAMHGARRRAELDKTVAAIRKVQSLETPLLSGMTALTQAIDFQDYDVVAALLRAEPELASRRLTSAHDPAVFNLPIHLAAQLAARRDVPEALSILRLLNDHTMEFNSDADTDPSRDHLGMTPLHLAVTGPSSRATRWILEKRTGLVEVEDYLGRTALHCCASEANLEALLSHGSVVMHTDRYGMSPLHRACLRGELGLVRCLLKHSQPLDLKDNMYGTPLHCAIINGSVDVVKELLDAGAPVNAQDLRGNTPVHAAVRMGRHIILRILLRGGGSCVIQNVNKRNPEQLASIIGTTQSIGTLRILQGDRKVDMPDDLFSGERDSTTADPGSTYTSSPFPLSINKGEAPASDFAWDSDSIAYDAVSERNASGLYEADRMRDEEPPAFSDGRKEKREVLEKLTNNMFEGMKYVGERDGERLELEDQVTTSLQAQILPYLDDSIWQDNGPPAGPIGKTLAGTVFGIANILEMSMADQQPRSPISASSREGLSTEDAADMGVDGYQLVSPALSQGDSSSQVIADITPTYLDIEGYKRLAIDQTIEIVEQTKPRWALPLRSREHLRSMIEKEVARIQLTGDTSALDVVIRKDQVLTAHPILTESPATEDRKRLRIELQQRKWHAERNARERAAHLSKLIDRKSGVSKKLGDSPEAN